MHEKKAFMQQTCLVFRLQVYTVRRSSFQDNATHIQFHVRCRRADETNNIDIIQHIWGIVQGHTSFDSVSIIYLSDIDDGSLIHPRKITDSNPFLSGRCFLEY